jgi:hypothetical protein
VVGIFCVFICKYFAAFISVWVFPIAKWCGIIAQGLWAVHGHLLPNAVIWTTWHPFWWQLGSETNWVHNNWCPLFGLYVTCYHYQIYELAFAILTKKSFSHASNSKHMSAKLSSPLFTFWARLRRWPEGPAALSGCNFPCLRLWLASEPGPQKPKSSPARARLRSRAATFPVCGFGSRASPALRSQNRHRSLAHGERQFFAFLQSQAGCSTRALAWAGGRVQVTSPTVLWRMRRRDAGWRCGAARREVAARARCVTAVC